MAGGKPLSSRICDALSETRRGRRGAIAAEMGFHPTAEKTMKTLSSPIPIATDPIKSGFHDRLSLGVSINQRP